MPDNSFDIVSKIDLAEVANAIQQAMKEVSTRFDLKDSKSQIAMEGTDAIMLHSADEFKMKAVNDGDVVIRAGMFGAYNTQLPRFATPSRAADLFPPLFCGWLSFY